MPFEWKFDIKGFGPFLNELSSTLPLSSSKVAIYAGNGQGKTCISRMFRTSAEESPSLSKFISHGTTKGSFSFEIIEKNKANASLSINKTLGTKADVTNNTDRLFHVFNSDYVQENLTSKRFVLNADIPGYILGKENIDLSEKKAELERLKRELNDCHDIVKKAVLREKTELEALGISKRTNEYKDFTVNAVLDIKPKSSDFDNALKEFKALKQLPDNIAHFAPIEWKFNKSLFDQAIEVLHTPYRRDAFSKNFIEDIKNKLTFIQEGMRLNNNNECPFCGQELKESALSIISRYEDYLSSRQAEINNTITSIRKSFEQYKNLYVKLMGNIQDQRHQFEDLLSAFPTHKSFTFPKLPENEMVEASIDYVLHALEEKLSNISESINISSVVSLQEMFNDIEVNIQQVHNEFQQFNDDIQKRSASLLTAKRTLCREAMKKVAIELSETVMNMTQLSSSYETLKKEIDNDESRTKKSKRNAVGELLAKLIHTIFGEKYTFNQNSFELLLHGNHPLSSPAEVMSDGEKSALAFCHYVASTYELLKNEADTEKLFFVIDDPISSLDFHYAYSIVDIIRSLDSLFSIDRVRMIVLTHNTAFFNLLARNNITSEQFLLNNGSINKCSEGILVPYSAHLIDIYNVANGAEPCHTTGNSLRQILETIWRFDNPSIKTLKDYLEKDKCSELKQCEYLYSLCNDQSHGASIFDRMQPIDEGSVRRACHAVLRYVHNRFPGQLIAAGIDNPQFN